MTTIKEILELKYEISPFFTFKCGPYRDDVYDFNIDYNKADSDKNIVNRVYVDHSFDHRRVWILGSIYFKGKPLFVYEMAGREGDDHTHFYMIDKELYEESLEYIRKNLYDHQYDNLGKEYSLEEDIPEIGIFYGYTLKHFVDDL